MSSYKLPQPAGEMSPYRWLESKGWTSVGTKLVTRMGRTARSATFPPPANALEATLSTKGASYPLIRSIFILLEPSAEHERYYMKQTPPHMAVSPLDAPTMINPLETQKERMLPVCTVDKIAPIGIASASSSLEKDVWVRYVETVVNNMRAALTDTLEAYPRSSLYLMPPVALAAVQTRFDANSLLRGHHTAQEQSVTIDDVLFHPFKSIAAMAGFLLVHDWSTVDITDTITMWGYHGDVKAEWWVLHTPFPINNPPTPIEDFDTSFTLSGTPVSAHMDLTLKLRPVGLQKVHALHSLVLLRERDNS